MNNNSQQPFSTTRGLGASSSGSEPSAMDQPIQKRRRLNSKNPPERLLITDRPASAAAASSASAAAAAPAAPPPAAAAEGPMTAPRATVIESDSIMSFFAVTLDNFDVRLVALQPLD